MIGLVLAVIVAAALLIGLVIGQTFHLMRLVVDAGHLLRYQQEIIDRCMATIRAQDATIEQLQAALRPGGCQAAP